MMIKVSDFIAQRVVDHGISHVFMVTGGGAMHLNDSFGKNPDLKYICFHHEQACAMAAESYARLTGKIAVVNVTSGPGGINALNGVYGAWTDSVPMLIISGQVRYDTTVRSTGLALRQLGDQEYDIIRSVAPMTKYAEMVTNPIMIRYHLERALFLAKAGRPGPCWIDVPLNVQGAVVDEHELRSYDPLEDQAELPPRVDRQIVVEVMERIRKAERPVLLAGSAIRSSGGHKTFMELIERLNIPVVTPWNAHDVIHDSHRLYSGRPGTVGDRPGNFVVQNADLLLVLGCRLNIRQISYNWKNFARKAFKVVVDIDPLELKKPTISPDLPVHGDVADFMTALMKELPPSGLERKEEWLKWCASRRSRYPVVLKEYWDRTDLVNPYCFIEALSSHLPEGQIVVTANGSACVCSFQAMCLKKGQRLYTNSGCASMGYDLPGAIGASFGSGGEKVVCIAGDGSIQMNLQELQTIVHYKLPIKIFVLNNQGYHSIRQTQNNFFGLPFVGCNVESGVSFPDMERIAYAYGMPFVRCRTHDELGESIAGTLEGNAPAICEIMVTPEQPFAPRVSSKRLADGKMVSKPLEDQAPFLERNELLDNMIIPLLPEE